MKVTKPEFVTVWQKATTLEEVVKKTGLAVVTVRKYAYRMRRQGVPLKALPGEGKATLNWADLAKLARGLLDNEQ